MILAIGEVALFGVGEFVAGFLAWQEGTGRDPRDLRVL
jgi:hypothetical protein